MLPSRKRLSLLKPRAGVTAAPSIVPVAVIDRSWSQGLTLTVSLVGGRLGFVFRIRRPHCATARQVSSDFRNRSSVAFEPM